MTINKNEVLARATHHSCDPYDKRIIDSVLSVVDEQQIEINQLKASIAAIHCRLKFGPKITDATAKSIVSECEFAIPELSEIGE